MNNVLPLEPDLEFAAPRVESEVPDDISEDVRLVAALKAGQASARAELFDRYGTHIQRVLFHILTNDPELGDLLHEVFVRALAGIDGLREPEHLRSWLCRIAVFTARGHLRARSRRRWLHFDSGTELHDITYEFVSEEIREAVHSTYRVLDRLPSDERVLFALRFINGRSMLELSTLYQVSLSTIKRRLGRTERRFLSLARLEPALSSWVEEGTRWGNR